MNIFVQCVIIVNLKVLVISYGQTIGLWGVVLFGIAFFYASSLLESMIFAFGDSENMLRAQVLSVSYWGSILGCVSLIMFFELVFEKYHRLVEREKELDV